MSMMLRTLFRDPLVIRPLRRAVKRMDDEFFWDVDLPMRRIRRIETPVFDDFSLSPFDTVSHQMASVMNRMQEDLEMLNNFLIDEKYDNEDRRKSPQEVSVKRTESGGLQLSLNVRNFAPEDLKIRLEDDNLVIEANNEQSSEDSYQKSHFKRWFKLPEDCNLETIKSTLTSDGRLVVDLPSSKPVESKNSREIPIDMENRKQEAIADQKKPEGSDAKESTNAK